MGAGARIPRRGHRRDAGGRVRRSAGLVQALSTGVQSELAKWDRLPGGPRPGGPVLRLAPQLPSLAGPPVA